MELEEESVDPLRGEAETGLELAAEEAAKADGEGEGVDRSRKGVEARESSRYSSRSRQREAMESRLRDL